MKIPAFWARATAEEPDGRGGVARFGCWRWSDVSQEDARQSALESARRIVRKLVAGEPLDRYGYGPGVLREELKQEFLDASGQRTAAITQNAYGSLVLNTTRMMFVDVDFPASSVVAEIKHFFRRWFDKEATPPAEVARAEARSRIDAFFAQRPDWAARIYRTRSGFRVLVTHDLFEPDGPSAREAFELLGADPLYRRLCRDQQCFRARLTPKPWRCDHYANPIRWPLESDREQRRFDAWQAAYLDKQAAFATCQLAGVFGNRAMHPDIAPLVEIHDRLTRTGEDLPLA